MELSELRARIDTVNDEILKLFLERMDLVEQVGEYKKTHHLPVKNRKREREILAEITEKAGDKGRFAYHLFSDAQNEEEFNAFVSKCKELSMYDTGITPAYGEKLITLSTCDYSISNGRLVVVARRIS